MKKLSLMIPEKQLSALFAATKKRLKKANSVMFVEKYSLTCANAKYMMMGKGSDIVSAINHCLEMPDTVRIAVKKPHSLKLVH